MQLTILSFINIEYKRYLIKHQTFFMVCEENEGLSFIYIYARGIVLLDCLSFFFKSSLSFSSK